jgi:phosphatidate cytidylyltransferase
MQDFVERISAGIGVPQGVLYVLAGIFAALVIGSIARLSHLHALPEKKARSLKLRLRTWWAITIVLTIVVLAGRPAIIVMVGLVSLVALGEYFRIVPEAARARSLVAWVFAAAVLQYVWIALGWYELCLVFVPVIVFLLLTLRIVLRQEPAGFLHLVGTTQWGMMMLVFCLSHAAMLVILDDASNTVGGPVGWFVYLVLLTELNDILQALWGRPFGRHKVVPGVSPGKSWEGLAGAVVCTTVLAVLLAPVLTPLAAAPAAFAGDGAGPPWFLSPWAAGAGLLIAVGGFFGDITMSAAKRDAHVKDSGTMLPGQGGILDRIDSLTFTAPMFFHAVHFLYG